MVEQCQNLTDAVGDIDCIECAGKVTFSLKSKNWMKQSIMELTLKLDNTDNTNNKSNKSYKSYKSYKSI